MIWCYVLIQVHVHIDFLNCKVHALLIIVLYTGHISVHMHISYVLGYVLRDGAGGGIGLERIVSVCNIIGHQEVVLWAPTFPTHLDPPSSYHQLVEEWGWGEATFVWCVFKSCTSRYV